MTFCRNEGSAHACQGDPGGSKVSPISHPDALWPQPSCIPGAPCNPFFKWFPNKEICSMAPMSYHIRNFQISTAPKSFDRLTGRQIGVRQCHPRGPNCHLGNRHLYDRKSGRAPREDKEKRELITRDRIKVPIHTLTLMIQALLSLVFPRSQSDFNSRH